MVYLMQRNGSLYHPGGSHPVCSEAFGLSIVRLGRSKPNFGRYEIAGGQTCRGAEWGAKRSLG
jgi:hypothetical protein